MDDLLEILTDLHPEVDFSTETALMDDGILDSFDLVSLMGDISDIFQVTIHGQEINPENFNRLDSIWALIVSKQGGD